MYTSGFFISLIAMNTFTFQNISVILNSFFFVFPVAMVNSKFSEAHSKLQSLQKDVRLAVNMSDSVDQPLHVGAAVNELFKKAKAKGYGEHDAAAVYRAAAL